MSNKTAPTDIPKTVWFEDSKGFMRELPSDTPARYCGSGAPTHSEGKMFPLHLARLFDGIEVHEHSWVSGTRVEGPKEMVFEIRLTVRDHLTHKDAIRKLHDILRTRHGGDEPSEIISAEVNEIKES